MHSNKRFNTGTKVATGTGLTVLAGSAMASGGGFDSSSIITLITANGVEATLIVGAFILAIWGLRAMGLFKRS